jgi:type I restriction enzyme R subunit
MFFSEFDLEENTLDYLKRIGWEHHYGPDIAPKAEHSERDRWEEAFLPDRLRQALFRLNPHLLEPQIDEVYKKVTTLGGPAWLPLNRQLHDWLTQGVPVAQSAGGEIRTLTARLIDFDHIERNEFWAVNQFTLKAAEPPHRRLDILLFVNGLPLVVVELKNPADENTGDEDAYNQLQTYKAVLPQLFQFNALLVASDGFRARVGSLTAGYDRFQPWKTIDGQRVAPNVMPEIEVLIRGLLRPEVLLDFIRYFTLFEETPRGVVKKIAAYHQYHAVNKAVKETRRAANVDGDRRCGVVWHTQGSGKSLSMVFFAGKLAIDEVLGNPTLVILTDRNDLDDQLFSTFGACVQLLRQTPVQAESRTHLRELLSQTASGGVVFTTIQKFLLDKNAEETEFPQLSARRNIVVVADEAHRSQYDFIDGFARNMRSALPNASFIGFTGTPIEADDRNTAAVFGDYIDVYDIQQAVEDGATVKILYESRLVKIELPESAKPLLDELVDELTEGQEQSETEKRKSKWAQVEAIVGSPQRLQKIAEDIIQHFEARTAVAEGKGMIVAMSRRVCVDLYNEIVKIRPEWHDTSDDTGRIKVVMTGTATDPPEWLNHIRTKDRNRRIAERLKDPSNPLKLVIVRDMWLTGFDAPVLHTLYIDKPMRGHNLAQAIARVNRRYKDKTGGLIVDYIGIARDLQQVVHTYSNSGGHGKVHYEKEDAISALDKCYEIIAGMFEEGPKFDYKRIFQASKSERITLINEAKDFIIGIENGKQRFVQGVSDLLKAFALAVPHERTVEIRDEVGFFQFVRTCIQKLTQTTRKYSDQQMETAIRQIVSDSLVTDKVVDVFDAAGLKKPEIAILSEEFLAEVQEMKHKNLAAELLQRLMKDQIRERGKVNLVQSRKFSEMLEKTLRSYHNNLITSSQVIEEMLQMARDFREADKRGEDLGFTKEEYAFYEALEVNDSAVQILGDEILRTIARELMDYIRNNTSLDWSFKENVRAKMRVKIKAILRKHGYPPDKAAVATETILKQSELIFEQ